MQDIERPILSLLIDILRFQNSGCLVHFPERGLKPEQVKGLTVIVSPFLFLLFLKKTSVATYSVVVG